MFVILSIFKDTIKIKVNFAAAMIAKRVTENVLYLRKYLTSYSKSFYLKLFQK